MKIVSFNCRELANPSKKSSLKRMVETILSDVILLQETMGMNDVNKNALETLLHDLSFESIDAKG